MDKILFVDDEENILSAFRREFRKEFEIDTATDAEEGLRTVAARGPFAVIVSDFRMPKADGNRFLAAVKKIAPDSVRVMLTGHADVNMAMQAVNEGSVFRFLTKPCPSDTLGKVLTDAIQQYRLVTAERELLENTLRGSIKVLTELLGLVNPEAFGRCSRIRDRVRKIAEQMKLPNLWQLETAALLSQIGCVIFPEDVLKRWYRNEQLTQEESQLFTMHPEVGSGLIANIPRMEEIAEIIKYQEKHFDGTGFPLESRSGSTTPIGAKILKVALDLDVLEAAGVSPEEALRTLRERKGWYDPRILAALETILLGPRTKIEIRHIGLTDLAVGMVLGEDLLSENDLVLMAKGQEVNLAMLVRLRQFAKTSGIREPFRVVVPPQAPMPLS
jgi:response regulator RpfG family c-di-GMP phosphodiesterase